MLVSSFFADLLLVPLPSLSGFNFCICGNVLTCMYTYMDMHNMYYTIYFEISMAKYTLYTAILVNELDQKLHWPATPPLYGAL